MKKLRVIQAVLVLFSALAITSCGEDITLNPGNGGQFTDSDLRMSFENTAFVADEVTANVAGGAITFTATRGTTGEMLTMTLNQTALTLSNMEVSPPNLFAYNNVSMTYMESAAGDQYVNVNPATGQTTGSMVITEVDIANRTISGHFAFVGYSADDAIAFHGGSFSNVIYTGGSLPQPTLVAPQLPDTQFLKAKVNGGEVIQFGFLSAQPASGNLVLSGGTQNPLTNLSITVPQNIAPGTYSFGTAPAPNTAYGMYNMNNTAHVSQSGTLTITTNNEDVIQGNFSFTATSAENATVEITEGQFFLEIN